VTDAEHDIARIEATLRITSRLLESHPQPQAASDRTQERAAVESTERRNQCK
jgi:hypothetical protein